MALNFSGKWRLQLQLKNMNPGEVDELGLGFQRFRVANSDAGRDIPLIYSGHAMPPVDITVTGIDWQVHFEENAGGGLWHDVAQFSVNTMFDPQRGGLVRVLQGTPPNPAGGDDADSVLICTDLLSLLRSPARKKKPMQFLVDHLTPRR